ncbi:MAG: DUF2520 domain-containing protein [Gemmatimonadota bacterium]
MSTVAVLGAGQLGGALAAALSRSGRHDVRLWSRSAGPTGGVAPGVRGSRGEELAEAIAGADLVVLAVVDGAVSEMAGRLAALEAAWRGRVALHCSGALPHSVLGALAERGAGTAACHPLRAFPRGPARADAFAGCPFTVDGTAEGEVAARALVRELGGVPLGSRPVDRAGYHLAAALASNYVLALAEWAAGRFREAGLSREDAGLAADALARNALDNARDAVEPLTGPLRRGDIATVLSHLARLEGAEQRAYAALGLLLMQRADVGAAEGGPHTALRLALESALDAATGAGTRVSTSHR